MEKKSISKPLDEEKNPSPEFVYTPKNPPTQLKKKRPSSP